MKHFATSFGIAVRRFALLAACLVLAPVPSHAAAKIQHLISPGGIEAWFVQDATCLLYTSDAADE